MKAVFFLVAMAALSPQVASAQENSKVDAASAIYGQLKSNKAKVFSASLPDPVIVVRADGTERSVSPGALDLLELRNEAHFGHIVSFDCKDVSADVVSCVSFRSNFMQRKSFRTDFRFTGTIVNRVQLFNPMDVATND